MEIWIFPQKPNICIPVNIYWWEYPFYTTNGDSTCIFLWKTMEFWPFSAKLGTLGPPPFKPKLIEIYFFCSKVVKYFLLYIFDWFRYSLTHLTGVRDKFSEKKCVKFFSVVHFWGWYPSKIIFFQNFFACHIFSSKQWGKWVGSWKNPKKWKITDP